MHIFTLEDLKKALDILREQKKRKKDNVPLIGQYQKAIECYRKCLEITEGLGDRGRIAYNSIGQYQKAIECHRKHLGISEELGDRGVLGRAHENLGNAYASIGQYQKAIECYRKDLEIVEELGDRRGVGRAHGNLGNVYYMIRQYQKAIECHRKDLEIVEELGDRRGVGRARGNLGIAYDSIGQYQKAIKCHCKCLEIAEELGDRGGVGRAHGNLGNVYCMIGQYQKAIECYRKCLEITEGLGDRRGVGRTRGNLGIAYNSIGQYQKAIECHRKDLEIAEELGDRGGVGIAHGNLGNAYHSIGQYQKAIECHRKDLEIAEELGERGGVGRAHGNLGNAYYSIGQYQKAIECHRKDLKIVEELGDRRGVGGTRGNLGIAYDSIGQYQKAIECHCKCLEIAEELGDRGGVGKAHGNLGDAYHSIGQYQKAIECQRKHLEIAKELGDRFGVGSAQFTLSLCHQEDDECLASSLFAKSILSFDSIRRSGIYEDQWNTSLSDLYNCIYKNLFVSLLNLKQVKAALLISECGKAKALSDLITRCVDVVLDSALEDNYTIAIKEISENPSSKTAETSLDVTFSNIINITVQNGSIISYTFDHRHNLHAWVISKRGVFHKEWQTMNGMSTKTYLTAINGELRGCLVRDLTQNISFLPNAYSSDTNIKDKFVDHSVIGEEDNCENNFARDLDKRVENLARSNNSRGKPDCDPNILDVKSVKERYNLDSSTDSQCGIHDNASGNCEENDNEEETCLGWYSLEKPNATQRRPRKEKDIRGDPLKQNRNNDTYLKKLYAVLISPIEKYLVGSKILASPEGPLFKVPFCALLNSKNEHLCEKYSLQFTPALHVLNLPKPLPNVGPALFVGNPIVGEVRFNDKLISPGSLPNASVEAKECSKYFSAEPLLEDNATKENVLNDMKDAGIIHIAAHGHMDHADIFLAPNEGAPKPPSEEHYLLTREDVLTSTLVARLVVLSCCHSGRGQISAEGVVGIARSFLGSGARSVLVTLWSIPDKSTLEFMRKFYEKVVQGLFVCVALQETMTELKGKFSISAWAPFQIVGEDISLSKDEIKEIRRLSLVRKTNYKDDTKLDKKRRSTSATINESERKDCDKFTVDEQVEK